jgi:hypothetical protein
MKLTPSSQNPLASLSDRLSLSRSPRGTASDTTFSSFQSLLRRSNSNPAASIRSQSGTGAATRSQAPILNALGVNSLTVRQNSAAEGAARATVASPRASRLSLTNAPSTSLAPDTAINTPAPFNRLQQNWMDANTGAYANLMRTNLTRTTPFQLESVDIRWANFSNGKFESQQRVVGNVSIESGRELAQLLGGTLVSGPFDTFGSTTRDRFIRMPNGQMIEAGVLAHQLNAARQSSDPFSATQAVLEIYQIEARNFNLTTSQNAVDLAAKGMMVTGNAIQPA